jgi:uncharacterized membrane protein YphA (DoxX/SURF4 family)
MPRAVSGKLLLAIAMFGLGLRYAHDMDISAGLPPLPAFLPGGDIWAVVMAILLISCGVMLLTPWHVRDTSLTLAAVLMGAALLHLLHMGSVLHDGTARTQFLEPVAMATAAFVLYGLAHHPDRLYLFIAARVLFAFTMIAFGAQHFAYAGYLASLVPWWVPFHVYWVWATGAAFILVGIAMISGILARPATIALAVMFLLFLVILHIPRILADRHNEDEWTSAVVAIGMCGAALLMSTSPRVPTLKRDLALETRSGIGS